VIRITTGLPALGYAESMLRVPFQRASMVILLVGMMVTPLGMCKQQSSRGLHSCCMQQLAAHAVKADCCAFRTQLPATLTAPRLQGSSPSEVLHAYAASVPATAAAEPLPMAVIPPLSPPGGARILRI
jgi:hypothetical protein